MHKLRTIDVWDTLLRRKAHPDFSKLISARALSLSHSAELGISYKDPWAIFRERCSIESDLAYALPEGDGEYEVRDILVRLLDRILLTKERQIDLQYLAESLADVELQYEIRNTYPDPTFHAFSQNYPAKKSIFLSDFYMNSDCIKRILRHHSLHNLVEDGICSCDVGLNKRSGKLFQYVIDQHGITAQDYVHIGDNLYADVKVPSELGIQAVLYLPEEEHRKRQEQAVFFNDRQALYRHISENVLKEAKNEADGLQAEERSAYLLGIRAAPLLVGFILFIAERALIDRVERLYFFTREGEFFLRIWRAVFPENRLAGLELPPVNLLEVSRISTFCASLREVSTDELMRLWNLYSTQSMFALLKTLGLESDAFVEICQAYDLSLMEEIVYPWKDERVQALFKDPGFRRLIEDKIDDDRSRLLDYLSQQGWSSSSAKVGIVDIGWRGTIQDNLAYLRPETRISGYYLGLQRFLNPQPENCSKESFGPNANISKEYSHFLDVVSLIEMLCNSPNGSVIGYDRSINGHVSALRVVDEGENVVYDAFVTHFQKGVLFASAIWSAYVDSHVILSAELRGPGCAIWHEFITKTQKELANAYASLNHNEVFGVGGFVNKRLVPSVWQLFQGVFCRRQRQEIISYLRQTQWVAGILCREDLGLIHRMLLAFALLIGRGYKRLMYLRRYR